MIAKYLSVKDFEQSTTSFEINAFISNTIYFLVVSMFTSVSFRGYWSFFSSPMVQLEISALI